MARPASSTRPRVDPRIADRRIAVKRDEGRRRLRRLAWVAGAVALVAAAALATRSPLLDVDHVRVAGTERVPPADILAAAAAAGAGEGDHLVDLREPTVARAVEALPGVAEATVTRRWPGTVDITVVERTPVAVVAEGGSVALVAADGVVVEVAAVAPAGLPALEAVEVDAEPGAVADAPELLEVAAALPAALSGQVVSIRSDGGAVELNLLDGGTARLGPVDDVAQKLAAVATVLDGVERSCIAVLDVRVPSAPAVTPLPGCPL